MDDGKTNDLRIQKALRLVEYLKKLASLGTKRIRDVDSYEKVLWISSIPHENGCFTEAWRRDEEHASDEWIEIQNGREPNLPAIPAQCEGWLDPTRLRSKRGTPALLPQITQQVQNLGWQEGSDQPPTIERVERLLDHPEIQAAWNTYIENQWLRWTKEHNAWESVHDVYSSLFAIHQGQLRLGEEYELIVGLGLLTWQTPTGQRVRRHLIAADAALDFDARLGRFTVRPNSEGAKVRSELDMLDITEQPAHAEESAKQSLAAADDDPWNNICIEDVLKALVHSIDSRGDYESSIETTNLLASSKPIVEFAPALILRKRSAKGLTEILNRIKQQIEDGITIPGEFADLAELDPQEITEISDTINDQNAIFDGEVFFPKPSNDEQRRIVEKIRATNGVLVQGPPGTGKSHTIANLICHLLATGQRILITAKTPRALKVLAGLLPEEMRPLCINLLGSGTEERKSLESSVGGILRKYERWNETRTKREREKLDTQLRGLREERTKIRQRLRDIRESETHSQSIAEGTYKGTAARVAEAVNANRSNFEWFIDSVPLNKPCPVSATELQRALAELRRFTPEKRRELNLNWPQSLPTPEQFGDLARREAEATEHANNLTEAADKQLADSLVTNDSPRIEVLCSSLSNFRDTLAALLIMPYSWMRDALRDILASNAALWHQLLHVSREVITSVEGAVALADETRIDFLETIDAKVLYEDARILKKHLGDGGKLGWWLFRPKPVESRSYIIKTVRISGHRCSTLPDFQALTALLQVRIELEKAWGFWNGRSEAVKGPYALQLAALRSLSGALEKALSLEKLIIKCRGAFNYCAGVREPAWNDAAGIERVISSCRAALACIAKKAATEEIQDVETPISSMVVNGGAHPMTGDLLSAIRRRDVDGFARCANSIRDLDNWRQRLKYTDEYFSKLQTVLPHTVVALKETCNEPHWEPRIEYISDAWHWAQARYWVEQYIREDDAPALADRENQIEVEINEIIAALASLNAWSICFSRLNENHRRHMESWQQSMRRLGKGTGKHAPHHRREAQGHLNECREAVPAWVMPLHRIWDTVHPSPGMFDLIIVDEASQCGFEALPLFYLGKKILVVGDDKQISPDAVGLDRADVHRLMEELLYDFRFKSSLDIEGSLFDHGKLRYGTGRVTLHEHFRCMPEIIRFSNDLCYSDTPLIPLRQFGSNRLAPLEQVFVEGGYREGRDNHVINQPEASAIVKRIADMCNDSKYDGKTMGVVVLQGEAQAEFIENKLLEQLGAEEIERRRLICGNPYSFQGDERDIIFLSMVAANNERIGAFTKPADERRFNVAASRARDSMILFHSISANDLSANCLRHRLLEFYENTDPQQIAGIERDELELRAAQDDRGVVSPPAPFDSWFEIDVALEILRRGFTVLSQYEIAGKRIDLVVDGGNKRLAIECDGDKWHGADRYEQDMQRQRQLERCGCEFFRVRESSFYANKHNALLRLWKMLEEREIYPNRNIAHAMDGHS